MYNSVISFNSLDGKEDKQMKLQTTNISWPGFLYGDGLSSNRLYCIHKRKTSEVTITKCLFRIEPSKKYFRKKNLTDFDIKSTAGRPDHGFKTFNEKLRLAQEEKEDYSNLLKQSLGMPVTYGQGVIIRHMFSGTYITLDVNQASRLIGNVKLNLAAEDNEYTNMKIIPLSKLRNIGDYVSYSDEIILVNLRQDHYFVHVSEFLRNRDEGLEINGSELKTEWKPYLYLPFVAENSTYTNPNIVHPGEVIQLHNNAIGGGYLSISKVSLENLEFKKQLVTTGGMATTFLNKIPMEYTYLINSNLMQSRVEISPRQDFYTLWEVQKIRAFDSMPPQYLTGSNGNQCAVRLKSVASQYYLACDKDDHLCLTYDGLNDQNIFYFSGKSTIHVHGMVAKGDLMKLRNYVGKFIQPMKSDSQVAFDYERTVAPKLEESQVIMTKSIASGQIQTSKTIYQSNPPSSEDREFFFGCSTKSDPNYTTFEIMESNREVLVIANKLSSLFNQLLDFYHYFQDWAMEPPVNKKMKTWGYSYRLAEKYEKELESEVEQLNQNLRNIYDHLADRTDNSSMGTDLDPHSVKSQVSKKSSLTLQEKKELLLEHNIIEVMIKILRLIEFKTIGSLRTIKAEKDDDKDETSERKLVAYQTLKNYDWEKFELLPQLIAKNRLEKSLQMILKILLLAVWDNTKCSEFLASKIDFLEELLDFYPAEVIELGCEIAKNLKCDEQTYLRFYQPWARLLDEVNERSGNIKRQINLLTLLANMTKDCHTGESIEVLQTRLFHVLYQEKMGLRGLKMMKFYLNDITREGNDGYIQIVFIISTARQSAFADNNNSIAQSIASNSKGLQIHTNLLKISQPEGGYDTSEHLAYIATFIRLFTSLCSNANRPIIDQVTGKDIGLTAEFCKEVLQERRISPIVKAAVAEFYSQVFVSASGFTRLSKNPVNCFDFDRLDNLVTEDGGIPRLSTEPHLNTMEEAAMIDLTIGVIKEAFIFFPKKIIENRSDGRQVNVGQEYAVNDGQMTANLETNIIEVGSVLEYQNDVLKLIINMLDIGIINRRLSNLSISLAGIVLKTNLSSVVNLMSCLTLFFLNFASSRRQTQPKHQQLIKTALDLLLIVDKLRSYNQICGYLKSMKENMDDEEAFVQALKPVYSQFSLSVKHIRLNQINSKVAELVNRLFAEDGEDRLEQQLIPVDLILAESLFSQKQLHAVDTGAGAGVPTYTAKQDIEKLSAIDYEVALSNRTIKIIMKYFSQRYSLFKEVTNIEFYHGDDETIIYEKLTNRNKTGSNTISLPWLTKLIEDVNRDDFLGRNGDAASKIRLKDNIEDLVNVLQSLTKFMRAELNSRVHFRKTQNLMRNLGFQNEILKLLKSDIPRVFDYSIEFLRLFIRFNRVNQKLLMNHYDSFMKLLASGHDCTRLLVIILKSVTTQTSVFSIVEGIFNNIRRLLTSSSMVKYLNLQRAITNMHKFQTTKRVVKSLETIKSYLIVIIGCLFDENSRPKRESQLAIVSIMINSPEIAKFFEKNFLDQVKKTMQLRQPFVNEDDMVFFNTFACFISLIAELSRGHEDCGQQARRISDSEFLFEYITSRQSHFLLKKQMLKWYHFTFFEPDSSKRLIKTDTVKRLLTGVILPDILQASSFLTSLVRLDTIEDSLAYRFSNDLSEKMKKSYKSTRKAPQILMSQMEFWDYLGLDNKGHSVRYGLLYFLFALIRYFKLLRPYDDIQICQAMLDVYKALMALFENLDEISRADPVVSISNLRQLICECASLIPTEKLNAIIAKQLGVERKNLSDNLFYDYFSKLEAESDEEDFPKDTSALKGDQKAKRQQEQIIGMVRRFLITNRLTFPELVDLVYYKYGRDQYATFRQMVGIAEKDYTPQNNNFLAEMSKLERDLYTYKLGSLNVVLIADSYIQPPAQVADLDLMVPFEKSLKAYVDNFLASSQTEQELKPWIILIKERMMMFDENDELIRFLKFLQNLFIRSNHIPQLLATFEEMLSKSIPPDESVDDRRMSDFRWLQQLFNQAEIATLCISCFKNGNDTILVSSACNVLKYLLIFGNHKAQKAILSTFEENLFTREFFHYTKDRFVEYIDLLKRDKALDAGSSLIEVETGTIRSMMRGINNHTMMISLLEVFKYFCDGCYIDFQRFLGVQTTRVLRDNPHSIDMVNQIGEFLVLVVKENPALTHPILCSVIKSLMNTLTEFVIGPCKENQRTLIENKKIIGVINIILSMEINMTEDTLTSQDIVKADILFECAIFIESLVIGNDSADTLVTLIDSLDKQALVRRLIEIYIFRISTKKQELLRDRNCSLVKEDLAKAQEFACEAHNCREGFRSVFDKIIIDSGFKLFLIMKLFEEYFEGDKLISEFGHKLKTFKSEFNTLKRHPIILELNKMTNLQQSRTGNFSNFYKRTYSNLLANSKLGDQESGIGTSRSEDSTPLLLEYIAYIHQELFNEARQFFSAYVASIEILHNGQLEKVHFQIPYFCKYISKSIQHDVIYHANRSSDQERLEHFHIHVNKWKHLMKRMQSLSHRKLMYFFVNYYKQVDYFSLFLVAVINLLMLVSFVHKWNESPDSSGLFNVFDITDAGTYFKYPILKLVIQAIGSVQLLVSLIVLASVLYSYYPLTRFDYLRQLQPNDDNEDEDNTNLNNEDEFKRYASIFVVFREWRCTYKTIHSALSIIGLAGFSLMYPLMLFDILYQASQLRRVIFNGVIKNYLVILLTLVITVIMVYFFSTLSFKRFPHSFDRVASDYTRELLTIVSEATAGRCSSASSRSWTTESAHIRFWEIYFFDMVFYGLIDLILLNILAGTIADSVNNIRQQGNELEEDIQKKCFICGLGKFEIDRGGEGWYTHIYKNHNVFDYLFFLIYIEKKDIGDCSSVEKSVKELSRIGDISFFPQGRALSFESSANSHRSTRFGFIGRSHKQRKLDPNGLEYKSQTTNSGKSGLLEPSNST